MSAKLQGKVAVVTAHPKESGASIAKHLAADGAAVVVNYSSSQEGADPRRFTDRAKGGKAVAVQANVAKQPDVRRLFADRRRRLAEWISWSTTPAFTSFHRWRT